MALLADGVAPDKLYPLDVDRAFKKLDGIKAQTVFWTTNSQSQQLFVDREVVAGIILNGRVYDAAQKGAKIALSWEQNIQAVDYLVVPRGSKNRAAAMRLIDTMTVAENQAKVANLIAYSPTNLEAYKTIDAQARAMAVHDAGEHQEGLRHEPALLARSSEGSHRALDGVEARVTPSP